MLLRPARDALRLEDVVALFEAPASTAEYARQFCELMVSGLQIAQCSITLGPIGAARIAATACAAAGVEAAQPSAAALEEIYAGRAVNRASALYLPLRIGGTVGGFVAMQGAPGGFAEREVRELGAFAAIAGLAIQSAGMAAELERLADRSSIDALTGTLNRRAFDERLRVEWRRAERDGAPLAIALIDVDQFKMYNDTYGHARGDEFLQQVARAIAQTNLRPGDFVARYGGAEFAIVMPGADEAGALALCDRVRLTIAARDVEHERSQHGVLTVSIGVAATVPAGERGPAGLLYEADTALFRAKQAGRNRVAGERTIYTSPIGGARSLLPPLPHGFIGRAKETDELVAANHRLLVIVGPAGIGKTALALELAHRTAERAVFVDLTHVERGDAVAAAVAAALAIEASAADGVVAALRDRTRHERLLLVLDRCEHLIAGVAQFALCVADVEGVRIVATSREHLHVEGEQIRRLGPMTRGDAVALFERCAREANPDLTIDRAERESIDRLVARLDAVPLAIEVAARALREFGFEELETNFDQLNARDTASAIDAALASSYLLLSSEEKHVFARLAAFPEDCSLDAARAVCGDRSGAILRRLADKSLVLFDDTPEGPRLHLLAATRAFAAARSRGLGDYDDAVAAHAAYYIGLLPDESLSASPGRLAMIRTDRANYDAALARAMAAERFETAGELIARSSVAYLRLLSGEDAIRRFIEMGRRVGEAADVPRELRLRVLAIVSYAAYMLGDLPLTRRLVGDLLARSTGVGDPYTRYAVTSMKYIAKIAFGEHAALLADADAVIEMAEATGSPRLCATTFYNLAIWGAEAGTDLLRAAQWARRGIEYARRGAEEMEYDLTLALATIAWRSGDQEQAAGAFAGLLRGIRAGAQPHLADLASIKAASFELARGNVDDALALLLDVLRLIRRTPMKRAVVGAIDAYVHAAALREKFDVALRLHAFVQAYREASGLRRTPFAQENYTRALERYGLPAEPGPPDLAGVDQAFALALTI